MPGPDRSEQVRTGQDRSGQDGSGWVRTGKDRSLRVRSGQDGSRQVKRGLNGAGWVKTGRERLGQTGTGRERSEQVRIGQNRSGQIKLLYNLKRDFSNISTIFKNFHYFELVKFYKIFQNFQETLALFKFGQLTHLCTNFVLVKVITDKNDKQQMQQRTSCRYKVSESRHRKQIARIR